MLEHFSIFTKSGFILWKYEPATLRGNPINELIKTILLEERGGLDSYSFEAKYLLKWTQANESDLVFVAVYQKILPLSYIDELLEATKSAFVGTYGSNLKPFVQNYSFDRQFDSLLREMQSRSNKAKETKELKKPATFENSNKMKKLIDAGKVKENTIDKNKLKKETPTKEPTPVLVDPEPLLEPAANEDLRTSTPTKVKALPPKIPGGMHKKSKKKKPEVVSEPAPGTKRQKAKRIWDDGPSNPRDLYYGPTPTTTATDQIVPEASGVGEKVELDRYDDSEPSSSTSDDDEPVQPVGKKNTGNGLMSFFTNIINRELKETDLKPVMAQVRDHLITKNVASEISEKLCDSVSQSLVGKQLGTFSRVSKTVREAMENALVRILTPKRHIDVLREARVSKAKNKPYVIVFVGVNGVGKSTSLAKVCSWLLQNELSVMMAACDTFRAGAVEQLQVHARNLGVQVFHRGYGKDPASIAAEAINKARKEQTDVVLIDTAGRMQDNEPLMRALSKLVGVNEPDLVLFVGEALVGNEAVDQLIKFNRALEEYSTSKNPRGIDGIFLTKFDTVDEKVGAAISMVYSTGQPIVFVGVGQKYSDVRQLNVQRIVSILLKT